MSHLEYISFTIFLVDKDLLFVYMAINGGFMSIIRRRTKAELPAEREISRAALGTKNTVKTWQEARECFTNEDIDETIKDPSYYNKKLKLAGRRPRQKKVLGDITYGDVENAIWHSAGQIVSIARRLKISVHHVQSIFKRYKLLDQEFLEFREAITDEVEQLLLNKIRSGDTNSTLFYLRCHAKDRGYTEHEKTSSQKRGVKMKIVKAVDGRKSNRVSSSNVVPFRQVNDGS